MLRLNNYILIRPTAAVIPEFGSFGELYTRVIEGVDTFIVKKSPFEIIEASAKYYGHSLEGAMKATKKALGPIDMPPVKISGKLGLYWFPSQSPYNKHCIWFALDHIKDVLPESHNKTNVILERGDIITINSRVDRFKLKFHRTQELKTTYEKRTDENVLLSYIANDINPIMKEQQRNIYHFIQSEHGVKIKRSFIYPHQLTKIDSF